MKQFLSFIVLLAMPLLLSAQSAPAWQWATGGGDGGESRGMGVTTDGAGNIYVTGFFSNSFTIGATTLVSNGGRDIFIAKFNAAGQLIWAKSAGGTENDKGSGIAISTTGEVLIAGEYRNSIAFGSAILSSAGEEDIFIAKYSSSGDVLWAKSAGGTYPDHISVGNGSGIAVDGGDNIYITGYYGDNPGSPPAHESASFGSILLTSAGGSDIFLAKYDKDGNAVWAKSAGGVFSDYGISVAVDNFGYIYISGNFTDPWAYFDAIKIVSKGFADVFIAKYDAGGNAMWAKSAGSDLPDGCSSVKVDINGYIYIVGGFNGEKMKLDNITLTNIGTFDAFISQYDASGNVMWAKNCGWTGVDIAHSITLDDYGNSYVTGVFSGKCIFDNIDTLAGFGGYDAYVAKYNNRGKLLWAQKAGGLGYDEPNSIALDNSGNIYISGRYTGTAAFGKHSISSMDSSDMFLAKLGPFPEGIRQPAANSSIGIYPNPATETLQLSNLPADDVYSITDVTGRTLLSGTISNKQQQINISTLSKGIYYIHLQQVSATRKFIKL